MPLTAKGEKIKSAMAQEYGAKNGEAVFYASKNAGKISGVDEMNEGSEGLKTYSDSKHEEHWGDDSHHHEFEGETGLEIEDKHRDAGMGLVHAKEEKEAAHTPNPKPLDALDAKFTHSFPNDPFGDAGPGERMKYTQLWSAAEMKNSPLAHFKE
jgi:hypothetical protein